MRLIHLSDLHLGKRLRERALHEDQKYILSEITKIIDAEAPQAVIIAGDVYDKPVPPGESVRLFDDFLCGLSDRGLSVFVISGNHDAPERIAFGGRLMEGSGVHMAPVYDGAVRPVELTDEFGPVRIYMLPFIKPVHVRRLLPEAPVASYTDAMAAAIARMDIDPSLRNVLVTHQFVTGAVRSDSEEHAVGGLDNVDAAVFDPFDYVALGHIHGPQSVGRDAVRYCGTPLKYSFSEARQTKSVTVADLGPKGSVSIRAVPLAPLHELRELRGTYDELTARPNYEGTATDDYLRVVLTDENDVRSAMARLRVIYPNILELAYDNARVRSAGISAPALAVEAKTELELLAELYERQNGRPMSAEQTAYARELFESIREEDP